MSFWSKDIAHMHVLPFDNWLIQNRLLCLYYVVIKELTGLLE